MWTCSGCNTEVNDQYDNCPTCGMGRDGSKPPIDFVRKKDAAQPGLPSAGQRKGRLAEILIVLAVIAVLLFIALKK